MCDVGRVAFVGDTDGVPAVELTVAVACPIVTFLIVAPRSSSDVLMTSGYAGCEVPV